MKTPCFTHERRHRRSKTAKGKESVLQHCGPASCSGPQQLQAAVCLSKELRGADSDCALGLFSLPSSLDAPSPSWPPKPPALFSAPPSIYQRLPPPQPARPAPSVSCSAFPLSGKPWVSSPGILSQILFLAKTTLRRVSTYNPGSLPSPTVGGAYEKTGGRPRQGQGRWDEGPDGGWQKLEPQLEAPGPKATVSRYPGFDSPQVCTGW